MEMSTEKSNATGTTPPIQTAQAPRPARLVDPQRELKIAEWATLKADMARVANGKGTIEGRQNACSIDHAFCTKSVSRWLVLGGKLVPLCSRVGDAYMEVRKGIEKAPWLYNDREKAQEAVKKAEVKDAEFEALNGLYKAILMGEQSMPAESDLNGKEPQVFFVYESNGYKVAKLSRRAFAAAKKAAEECLEPDETTGRVKLPWYYTFDAKEATEKAAEWTVRPPTIQRPKRQDQKTDALAPVELSAEDIARRGAATKRHKAHKAKLAAGYAQYRSDFDRKNPRAAKKEAGEGKKGKKR